MGISAVGTLWAVAIMYLNSLGQFEVPVPKWLLLLTLVRSKTETQPKTALKPREKLGKSPSGKLEEEMVSCLNTKQAISFLRCSPPCSTTCARSPTNVAT